MAKKGPPVPPGFKLITTLRDAVPLFKAGLLWYWNPDEADLWYWNPDEADRYPPGHYDTGPHDSLPDLREVKARCWLIRVEE